MNILRFRSWDRTYRLAESLAPKPSDHFVTTNQSFQSPKAFICFISHWMNHMLKVKGAFFYISMFFFLV